MSKKPKTLEKLIVETWKWARKNHTFIKEISDEAFRGYVTLDVRKRYYGRFISEQKIFDVVGKLIAEGKI